MAGQARPGSGAGQNKLSEKYHILLDATAAFPLYNHNSNPIDNEVTLQNSNSILHPIPTFVENHAAGYR
jgi:hypothetical protein